MATVEDSGKKDKELNDVNNLSAEIGNTYTSDPEGAEAKRHRKNP